MAQLLFLKNGSRYIVTDAESDMRCIIEEQLGDEAAQLFQECVDGIQHMDYKDAYEDAELASDGYRSMLSDIQDRLDDLGEAGRKMTKSDILDAIAGMSNDINSIL